jgi:hypothetical protein
VQRRHQRLHLIQAVGVALRGVRFGNPAPGEQVRYFTDCRHILAGRDHAIQQRVRNRRHRVIVAVGGALKRSG